MADTLSQALDTLRAHQEDLQGRGVLHAAVFGSVARGEATADSDIDVLVELDPRKSIGMFEYSRIRMLIGELLGGNADIVNRKTLKPLLRAGILREAVDAF